MKTPSPLAVTLGLLAVTLGAVAAPGKAKDDKDDAKRLEGEWALTDWQGGGVVLPLNRLETARWAVKGDKYTFEMGDYKEEGTLKVDPAKKPATIDLAITSGSDKGESQVGIYKVEGDTITFCFNRPGAKERPTEFKSTEENRQILVTVKRAKKAE